ncbi:hypothetical protein IHE44_0011322 [Lamprotornis superbus]|uniref:G-protein coupled receptors family 1 profile domain-containing protein n=1 Tax=Lamprotornis superbus TaxID=245042 RepID=A0A835TTB2_9PASS|nr:hypothetical protein IHE44_0011322 [Lamprotornis superbus]
MLYCCTQKRRENYCVCGGGGSLTSAGDHINLSPVVKPQSVPVGEEIAQEGGYLGAHSDPSCSLHPWTWDNKAILVAIVILYARIYILVKSSSRNVTNHNNSERSMALLRTVVIVVSVFIACWSPLFILFLIDVACRVKECSVLYKAHWFIALAVINSAMNPIIYTLASKEMRRAFFRLVCGCLVKSKVARSLPIQPTPDNSRTASNRYDQGPQTLYLSGAKNKTHDNYFNLSEDVSTVAGQDTYRKLELPYPLHPAVGKVPSSAEGVFGQQRDGTGLPHFSPRHTCRTTEGLVHIPELMHKHIWSLVRKEVNRKELTHVKQILSWAACFSILCCCTEGSSSIAFSMRWHQSQCQTDTVVSSHLRVSAMSTSKLKCLICQEKEAITEVHCHPPVWGLNRQSCWAMPICKSNPWHKQEMGEATARLESSEKPDVSQAYSTQKNLPQKELYERKRNSFVNLEKRQNIKPYSSRTALFIRSGQQDCKM